MARTSYLIGLGSNRSHGRHGAPAQVIAAAIDEIAARKIKIRAISTLVHSAALGPAGRDFVNAAILVRTKLDPPALLARLKQIERAFGRRAGRRWGARVIDLDILAWGAGSWPTGPRQAVPGRLAIPHPPLANRDFAIGPAAVLAPHWRHPLLRATLRQIDARRRRARPVDRASAGQ
jgi:2-amino-4-hydroxy-6-hydroxymethyldihydropteridine diphosphokinase